MSRIALAAVAAVLLSGSVAVAEPHSQMGMAISPNGGNASIHQWGGIDDAFSVNPDGDANADAKPHGAASMAHNQDDNSGDDGDGDPGTDHSDEILRI